MIFCICWLGYEGKFPENLWDAGGGGAGKQGGRRERKTLLPPACWFPCDRHKPNPKPPFWVAFCLFVGFCCLFACSMRPTRCVIEIFFDIKCPFHFSSSSQACLIRERTFGMQLWWNLMVQDIPLPKFCFFVHPCALDCHSVCCCYPTSHITAPYPKMNARSRPCSVCEYFKVKSGKIGSSNRQRDRNQDGQVFKVSGWGLADLVSVSKPVKELLYYLQQAAKSFGHRFSGYKVGDDIISPWRIIVGMKLFARAPR